MPNPNELVINISGSAKEFLDELELINKKTKDLQKVLTTSAKAATVAFAGFSAAIVATTSAFIDYEKALVGVGKTTNIEGKQLERFGKQFQRLSDDVPLATNELLGIAQAAGQLGVSGEKNLLKFTETVAKLGVATDLSGEQAATTLTRILNVTGEGIETIDTFGSVIVALGNNFAATESEIARMANEVARSTGVFDVSAAQAAALGTALRSLGVRAELGGSAVGKTFRTIDEITRTGGDKLIQLNKIVGTTGDEFRKSFEEDSVGAFEQFIQGLGEVVANGGSAALELEKLGLKGDEINKVLPTLAKNSELVGKALKTAAEETKNATALNIEAEKAFNTLGAEKQKLINTATDLAVEIGTQLAPTIKEIIVDIKEFLVNLRTSNSVLIENIGQILKWGAAISAAAAGIATFLLGAIKISAIITSLGAAFLPATVAASGFWVALTGPIGIAVAGLVAVGAGIAAVVSAANNQPPETLQEINAELDELIEKRKELERGGIRTGLVDNQAIQQIDKEIEKLKDLKEARNAATEDFGTGSLLIRPEADKSPIPLDASAFGIEQQQEIPFAAGFSSDDAVEEVKKTQDAIDEVIDSKTQKRIDNLKLAVQAQREIQKARAEGETEEEKNLLERRAAIENEFRNARTLANAEERKLALENLTLKHEQERAEIAQNLELIALQRAEALQREEELEKLFEENKIANADLISEEDQVRLAEKLQNEEEIKQQFATQEAERVIAERNQRLADEQQFGERFAAINAFFRQQDIQNAKDASGQLIKLTQSKNATLKTIGKAAASANAAISTAEGAIAAYKSLAGIPIVGPALGAAAAAALIAFGVEQQQSILAANTGGLVPNINGARSGVDSVPSLLTPNEIVAPAQSFDEVVEGTALARGFSPPDDAEGGGVAGGGTITVELVPTGDLREVIERQQIEAEVQNTNLR